MKCTNIKVSDSASSTLLAQLATRADLPDPETEKKFQLLSSKLINEMNGSVHPFLLGPAWLDIL